MMFSKHSLSLLPVVALLACGSLRTMAEEQKPAKDNPTVAVMDFDSNAPGNPSFGKQIAEVVAIRLSLIDNITVVERTSLNKVLAEQKLALRGLTNTKQATHVGKLLGAEILILGRIFPVGDELFVAIKFVGVQSGRLKGAIVTAQLTEDLGTIVDRTAEKITAGLREHVSALVPGCNGLADPLERLRQQVKGRALPTIAVVVPETHLSRVIPDPAAQTEIERILISLGCTVKTTDRKALAGWAHEFSDDRPTLPPAIGGIDLIIVGEGFSESAAGSYEGLRSCAARVELHLVRPQTGEVLLTDRTTERAADLSEHAAAKTALQHCGHVLGMRIAEKLVALFGDDS